jgi:hypothetical protein
MSVGLRFSILTAFNEEERYEDGYLTQSEIDMYMVQIYKLVQQRDEKKMFIKDSSSDSDSDSKPKSKFVGESICSDPEPEEPEPKFATDEWWNKVTAKQKKKNAAYQETDPDTRLIYPKYDGEEPYDQYCHCDAHNVPVVCEAHPHMNQVTYDRLIYKK